jgi:micrococcal nuclease
MYSYRAKLVRVVDGDTVDLKIDLGFKVEIFQRVRLSRINAPELKSSDPAERVKAKEATDFVSAWFAKWTHVLIETEKSDLFGRYLGDISSSDRSENLNSALLGLGLATIYGRKEK